PAVASGTPYTIAVTQQPSSPTQTCNVTAGGTGTIGGAPVTGVTLSCATKTFPISVSVNGLSGSKTALTVDDGVDAVDLFADGTTQLPTPLASGTSYTLTFTQPTMPWKTCSVTTGNGAGTVGSTAISVGITCTLNTSKLVATVTGLSAPQNALQVSDGVDTLQFSANGRMAFPTAISSGGCYAFTLSDGTGQACDLTASVTGGKQTCVFEYSASATYETDGSEVFNSNTGGLCNCFQSNVD